LIDLKWIRDKVENKRKGASKVQSDRKIRDAEK